MFVRTVYQEILVFYYFKISIKRYPKMERMQLGFFLVSFCMKERIASYVPNSVRSFTHFVNDLFYLISEIFLQQRCNVTKTI